MKLKLLLPMLLLSSGAFAQAVQPEVFATGFTSISEITHAGTNRLYVVQQSGQIRIVEADGTINSTPFINLSSIIRTGGEQGLLGLAFHPEYSTNGLFYVYYVNTAGDIEIARYSRSTNNPDIADIASNLVLLTIPHPVNTNHNGGSMHFGTDGYLYISTGDGGGGGDPNGNAQNTNVLLGKMLRIDVNVWSTTDTNYLIPATNPFIDAGGAPEVWAYGLRNAWKFSFDTANGTMWIADVGQNQIEEINKVTPAPGLNFGWRCYEGNFVFNNSGCAAGSTMTFPVAQYDHSTGGCSITGGYVYHGTTYPELAGKYVFADYCSNRIGYLDAATPGEITWSAPFAGNFTTFGQDINGELYVAGGTNGTLYKVTDATAGVSSFNNAGISLYPNPANNEVFVNLKNTSAALTATIYDIGGKRLLQQQLTKESNRIDTSALQAGVYMLEVNAAGNRMQQKLIIN